MLSLCEGREGAREAGKEGSIEREGKDACRKGEKGRK